MIDGVTIIETISQSVETPMASPWIIVFALFGISIAAGVEALSYFKSKRIIEGTVASLVIVVSIFVGLFGCGVFKQKPQETVYIVTIDDNVSAKEFHDMYDVVSINGDKYTVRLIENSN